MAVRKAVKKEPVVVDQVPEVISKVKNGGSKWLSVGWVLLLLGGLAHMLPEQMGPLMKFSLWGVSLQVAVGTVSVIVALNFLLDEE